MKYLTEKEQKHLLRTVREVKGRRAERDYMILSLGFNTGLRIGEIEALNVGDVRNKEVLYVRPETTKTGKGREVPLNRHIQREIKALMRLKLSWREWIADDVPLFISKKGRASSGRLKKRSLQDVFEYWCRRAGLTLSGRAAYSAHSMRHSCAMRMRERGVSIETVQEILGHTDINTTRVYFQVTKEDKREAVEAL